MIASEPFRVAASDGAELAATVFRPPAPRRVERAVVVCSAMGVRRRYYYSFAEHLAESGCAVVTFDYRGVGGSRSMDPRRCTARLSDWGKLDVAAMIGWSRETFSGRPLSLVGHSIGSHLFGLAAGTGAGGVGDVLAVGSQNGHWRHWAGASRLKVMAFWFLLVPTLTRALGYFPSHSLGLGEDLPAGVAREWARWGRHPCSVAGRLDATELRGFEGFEGRLRALGASDDDLAPPPAVRAFLDLFPGARKELREVRPAELGLRSIGHFGYFRESVGERLWPEEVRWLLK